MQSILGLPIFLAVILAPMAGVMYGSMAFGWGLYRYPKTTALVGLLFVMAMFMAGLTYNWVFPRCKFRWGRLGGHAFCAPAPQLLVKP